MAPMTPVRSPLIPAPPLSAQTSTPVSAQRAFFAALNGAAAATAPSPTARIETTGPRRATEASPGPETLPAPERVMRPGARLDIRV